MKSSFRFRLWAIYIILTIILLSCSQSGTEQWEPLSIAEGMEEGLEWEILIQGNEHYYTDIIPVTLIFHTDNTQIEIRESWTVWGDFRLYSLKQIGYNSYLLNLQPRKTGLSVFRTHKDLPFSAQFELNILSRLKEGETEVLPLIQHESEFSFLWFLLAPAILIPGFILFFILRKKKKEPIPSRTQSLADLLEIKYEDETEKIDFYRNAFKLLLNDLCTMHPAVRPSDGPSELMAHLESPSALNQWALRGLYPLLEDWEICFFAPPADYRIETDFERNRNILKEWVRFKASSEQENRG